MPAEAPNFRDGLQDRNRSLTNMTDEWQRIN